MHLNVTFAGVASTEPDLAGYLVQHQAKKNNNSSY
jgi:hypothetical protein